jgi:hypothetical protein
MQGEHLSVEILNETPGRCSVWAAAHQDNFIHLEISDRTCLHRGDLNELLCQDKLNGIRDARETAQTFRLRIENGFLTFGFRLELHRNRSGIGLRAQLHGIRVTRRNAARCRRLAFSNRFGSNGLGFGVNANALLRCIRFRDLVRL